MSDLQCHKKLCNVNDTAESDSGGLITLQSFFAPENVSTKSIS